MERREEFTVDDQTKIPVRPFLLAANYYM